MIISGKDLAEKINNINSKKVQQFSQKGITPKIVIITLGPESVWKSYVDQKIKLAGKLEIQTEHINFSNVDNDTLLKLLNGLDKDPKIHGIIVQRPLPENINKEKVIEAISPKKDIDGFRPDSYYKTPIWLAILNMLKNIHSLGNGKNSFENWLVQKNIAVLGKGETGGKPIIKELNKLNIKPIVIDSKTEDIDNLLKNADIIISATGKSGIINKTNVKSGAVVIGIGMHRGEDGKLKGDYDETEIQNIVSFYSPTPGGVGPLNLAYLFDNLIQAVVR